MESKNENSTSPKEKKEKRKLIINGKEYQIEVGKHVPTGFWGWDALTDKELEDIVNAVLETLRKKPLIAQVRLYDYAERYLKEPFERGERLENDKLLLFINELLKNEKFVRTLKTFNAKGETDWIENYKQRKFNKGLGSIANMLDKIIEGLLELKLIRKVGVKRGDAMEVYYVPSDMDLNQVYEVLGLNPPGKEPEKEKKIDIMEKLVQMAKKIAANREYGAYLLRKWSSIIGKKEAEREIERLRKRLYFGKRIIIAMLNELGIRANNKNYSKFVDILELNIRLKNEGLPIDPKALSLALKRTKLARGEEVKEEVKLERVEIPKIEVTTKVTQAPAIPIQKEEKRRQLTLEETLGKIDFSNPFAVFYQIGRFGLEVQSKLKELDEIITNLSESKLDKALFEETLKDLESKINNALAKLKEEFQKQIDEKTKALNDRINALENGITKLIERMDTNEKRLENGFLRINKAFGKLQQDTENSIKYIVNEFNKLRKQVVDVQNALNELINIISDTIRKQAEEIISKLFEALGEGLKKKIKEFEKNMKELEYKVQEALKKTPVGIENRVRTLEIENEKAKTRELIMLMLMRRKRIPYSQLIKMKYGKEVIEELKRKGIVRITEVGIRKKRKCVELII